MRRPDAGFTLIELIMTIAIIGIIAAIALPNFVDFGAIASENMEKSTIAAIQTGIELQNLKDAVS